jgi:hypothetical protein
MKKQSCIWLSPGDRATLDGWVADRNSPQKLVWRACIVLMSAAGCGTMAIVRAVGKRHAPAGARGHPRNRISRRQVTVPAVMREFGIESLSSMQVSRAAKLLDGWARSEDPREAPSKTSGKQTEGRRSFVLISDRAAFRRPHWMILEKGASEGRLCN